MNQSVGTYTDLLLGGNFNVKELNYGCGPSSALVAVTDRCEVNEDDQDCENEASDEYGDDESDGDGNVQVDGHIPPFLTINHLMENEQGKYLFVDVPSCDVLNNPNPEELDPKDPYEKGTVNYHLTPSPRFENVKNFGNVVLSDWTP